MKYLSEVEVQFLVDSWSLSTLSFKFIDINNLYIIYLRFCVTQKALQ